MSHTSWDDYFQTKVVEREIWQQVDAKAAVKDKRGWCIMLHNRLNRHRGKINNHLQSNSVERAALQIGCSGSAIPFLLGIGIGDSCCWMCQGNDLKAVWEFHGK